MNRHYDVELGRLEARYAAGVGARRQAFNWRRGHYNAHGLETATYAESLAINVQGAYAELAVAKVWALTWSPVWAELDPTRPDVGNLHVRATGLELGCLPIRSRDLARVPEAPFVLVLELVPARRYRVAGWIRCRLAQWWAWRRAPGGRPPAYFVPQGELRPCWTLDAHDEAAP